MSKLNMTIKAIIDCPDPDAVAEALRHGEPALWDALEAHVSLSLEWNDSEAEFEDFDAEYESQWSEDDDE